MANSSMQMSRAWAMPNADTFSVPVIGDLVQKHLRGVSVDPFARNKRWATYTNDLNPETAADHHMNAPDFLNMLADRGVVADVVIFDPPYSPTQMKECYDFDGALKHGMNAKLYAECRAAIRRLCKKGTVVMSFGWNSCGMGEGFTPVELLLVAHGGAHNDTICFVEEMTHEQLDLI